MLYVHAGGSAATLEDIRSNYRVPTVEELRAARGAHATEGTGRLWTPVHHANLIDDIHAVTEKRGLAVKREGFALSKDTHSIYGFMEFEGRDIGRTDMAPVLGFRADNLQRFRIKGVSGSRVFICDNGAIVGDFVFGFKHTTNNVSGIEVGIDEGMAQWDRQIADMNRFVEFMERTTLTSRDADHALVEALRARVISSSQIGKIDETYRAYERADHPHRAAFAPRNAWSLYNAVTEVAKDWRSPLVCERGLKGFPRLVADMFGYEGLDALTPEDVEPSLN